MPARVRPLTLALLATGVTLFVLGLIAQVPLITLFPWRALHVVAIACVLGSAWLLWHLLRTRVRVAEGSTEYAAASGAVLLLALPFLPVHVLTGDETTRFTFWLLLALCLLQRWTLQPLAARTRAPLLYRFAAGAFAGFVAGVCRRDGFVVAAAMLSTAVTLDLYEARAEAGLSRRARTLLACIVVAFALPALCYSQLVALPANSSHAALSSAWPGLHALIDFVAEPAIVLLLLLGISALLLRCLHRVDLLLLPALSIAVAFQLRSEHGTELGHRALLPYVPFLVLLAAPALTLVWTGNRWARAIKGVALAIAFTFCFVLPSPVYKRAQRAVGSVVIGTQVLPSKPAP